MLGTTIDWLVKNVPGHNRKVGLWGTSYPGWLTLAALRDPHPALAAAVPFNPVVDVWKADDWFHWGAFRITYAFDFIYSMETKPGTFSAYPYGTRDLYTWLLGRGAAASAVGPLLDERHEMWSWLMKYPAYGPYWKSVAADTWFEKPTRIVPTLHVHGLWDQEDIYGAPAAYAALETHDAANTVNFLAIGPWHHGQHFGEGSSLGPLVDGRPDVLTWVGEPLEAPLTVRGPVTVKLFAETTGTDADWFAKLIDVFPDEDPEAPERSGMQIMISADIFRFTTGIRRRSCHRSCRRLQRPTWPSAIASTIAPHTRHAWSCS